MKPFTRYTDTLAHAAEMLRTRQITSRALVQRCLAAIDAREDQVRAWVFVDSANAKQRAAECDAEIAAGNYRAPMHGIPIAIKDIFDVAGWPTAAGFEPWKDRIAEADAFVVRRLREAGAIFLGKTVTTQFASFDPPVTRNPWNLERTPGGSSSGSAAAVACGMCYAALASQTGGSITRPASYCGVAGFKPSFGRIPEHGILPLAPSMDHPGAIARTVQDLADVFDVIGQDDEYTQTIVGDCRPVGAIAALGQPPRLARLRGHFEERAAPVVRESMDFVTEKLEKAGATVLDMALPASFGDVIGSHRTVMAVEAAAWHEARYREHAEEYLPAISALLDEGLAARAVDYRRAIEHQTRLRLDMSYEFFMDGRVDALLAPATTNPAPGLDTTGDPAFNSPWSFTGMPVISCPFAWTPDGLPLAIQLVGPERYDRNLFSIAAWCEEKLQVSA